MTDGYIGFLLYKSRKIVYSKKEWGTNIMPRGSRILRFVGVVELINSLVMFIWMLYLYFDYRTSPLKEAMDAINSSYGTIRLLIVVFELYKLIAAAYVIKKGDYYDSAIPIIVNGVILGIASGLFLYYATSNYIDVTKVLKYSMYLRLNYSTWREITVLVSASVDVLLMIAMILGGVMNRPKTVMVNSWGDPNRLPAVNSAPRYPQQEYQQNNYQGGDYAYQPQDQYGGQYYDGAQQYYDDGAYYDDGQGYYAQDQYTQGDQFQQ